MKRFVLETQQEFSKIICESGLSNIKHQYAEIADLLDQAMDIQSDMEIDELEQIADMAYQSSRDGIDDLMPKLKKKIQHQKVDLGIDIGTREHLRKQGDEKAQWFDKEIEKKQKALKDMNDSLDQMIKLKKHSKGFRETFVAALHSKGIQVDGGGQWH